MSATRKLESLSSLEPVKLTVVSDLMLTPSGPRQGVIAGITVDHVLGRVLNINILGEGSKICSYNCAYCQMGPTTVRLNQVKKDKTLPSMAQVIDAVSRHMSTISGSESDFETLLLTGNGEPTLHPDFSEIVGGLLHLRRSMFPLKKLAIRTNASTLDSRKVLDAVNLFDERVVKIDVGNDRLFKQFNNPLTRKTLSRLIADVRSLKDVLIETYFVKGSFDNTDASDVEDWMEIVAMAQPKRVYLRTIPNVVMINGIKPCDEDTLYTIASRFERRTQIRTIVSD